LKITSTGRCRPSYGHQTRWQWWWPGRDSRKSK